MKKLVVQNLLKVWLCAMVSFMTVTLYAQGNSFKVSGTVKDNTGELVIGATVIDTKTKNGCVTDVDGNFSLEVTKYMLTYFHVMNAQKLLYNLE